MEIDLHSEILFGKSAEPIFRNPIRQIWRIETTHGWPMKTQNDGQVTDSQTRGVMMIRSNIQFKIIFLNYISMRDMDMGNIYSQTRMAHGWPMKIEFDGQVTWYWKRKMIADGFSNIYFKIIFLFLFSMRDMKWDWSWSIIPTKCKMHGHSIFRIMGYQNWFATSLIFRNSVC